MDCRYGVFFVGFCKGAEWRYFCIAHNGFHHRDYKTFAFDHKFSFFGVCRQIAARFNVSIHRHAQ